MTSWCERSQRYRNNATGRFCKAPSASATAPSPSHHSRPVHSSEFESVFFPTSLMIKDDSLLREVEMLRARTRILEIEQQASAEDRRRLQESLVSQKSQYDQYVAALTNQLQEAHILSAQQKQALMGKKTTISDKDARVACLEEELQKNRNTLEQYSASSAEQDEKIARQRKECQIVQARENTLRDEVAKANRDLVEKDNLYRKLMRQSEQALNEKDTEVARLRQKCKEVEDEKDTEVAKLREKCNEVEDEKDTEIARLHPKCKEVEDEKDTEVPKLREKCHEVEDEKDTEIARLRQKCKEVEDEKAQELEIAALLMDELRKDLGVIVDGIKRTITGSDIPQCDKDTKDSELDSLTLQNKVPQNQLEIMTRERDQLVSRWGKLNQLSSRYNSETSSTRLSSENRASSTASSVCSDTVASELKGPAE